MKLTLYQVDAFTDKLFHGNPAAIIPLKKWIDDELMQQIALENNLSETAFFVPSKHKKSDYDLRWFTPGREIDLCGHATLASAFVIFEILKLKKKKVVFNSISGPLTVTIKRKMLLMDFPSWMPEKTDEYPKELITSIGSPEIAGVYKNREYIVELMNEDAVKKCRPDFTLMGKVDRMVIITAPGNLSDNSKVSDKYDFVSRFFAPNSGINEDSVTGSAHSQLIPFWSYKLDKKKMNAKQLSQRGGEIYCEQKGDRVIMGGNCVFYMKGEIALH